MTRAATFDALANEAFDVLIVGGGATGLGAAVDAVSRGYRTALVEAADFAAATSSRSTKLVHGGVRYLQQGNVALVREALHERANLLHNAPHLVEALEFVCPAYRAYEAPMFVAGFKAYDALAGSSDFTPSRFLGRRETLRRLPDLRARGLFGAIAYSDGQFDDARLALALARTAVDRGATVVNYARATTFAYARGRVCGATVRDAESGRQVDVRARAVVNATGIFVDDLRALDGERDAPLLAHSRGAHVVFAAEAFRGRDALLVPKTADGRVLFVIPWQGHVVIGTTDVPVAGASLEVAATGAEIDFIVEQANAYLATPLRRGDALATFAGLRPLVGGAGASTAKLSREHLVRASASGVVTVTGGKWTTYRKMAEDTIDAAAREGALTPAPSRTRRLALHGSPGYAFRMPGRRYAAYGTDAAALLALEAEDPSLAAPLDPRLPYAHAQVAYAARYEFARTVADVLARRTRALFLDVAAARAAAPAVAVRLAHELGRDDAWRARELAAFEAVARTYAFQEPATAAAQSAR